VRKGVSQAKGSNMFEGFAPTPQTIEIIRDYVTGKISLAELIQTTKTNQLTFSKFVNFC
jgi:hypothetical protein